MTEYQSWYANKKVLDGFCLTMYKLGFWEYAFEMGSTFNYIQIYANKDTDANT